MSSALENGNGPVGVPFVKGFDPRRTGGKPGRSGRPSNDVREACAADLQRPKVRRAAIAILEDPNHQHHAAVRKTFMAYAYGTPKQTIDLTTDLPALRVVESE